MVSYDRTVITISYDPTHSSNSATDLWIVQLYLTDHVNKGHPEYKVIAGKDAAYKIPYYEYATKLYGTGQLDYLPVFKSR